VLCLLIALAWWGHEHHWKIPEFSQLGHGSEASHSDVEVTVPHLDEPPDTSRRHLVQYAPSADAAADLDEASALRNVDRLPQVRFESADVVSTAGIQLDLAENRPIEEFVVAHAVVDYDQTQTARLSTRVPGIVWRVDKRIGEHVKKGEVLALIDSAEVGRAKAEFMDAVVQCDLKKRTIERLRSLKEVISGRRLREAEADWRAAEIQRLNAKQKLITLGLPVEFEGGSPVEVDELVAEVQFLGLPDSIVSSIRSETQSANLIPLVSPLDGVIVRRDVVQGETAGPSQTLFIVANVSDMWLRLNVPAEDVSGLANRQDVLFSADGAIGDLHGTLIWVGTDVDPKTRTVRALASVNNPVVCPGEDGTAGPRLLQANAYGTARIRVRVDTRALAVPSKAVRWLWNASYHVVFVPCADGISFQPRRVRPGIARDGYTEILAGLKSGEPVVSAGARLLEIELAHTLQEDGKPSLANAPSTETADGGREQMAAIDEPADDGAAQ
jgi:cobalt-zinc-cadmium efflux system membrane fusion protein